MDGIETGMEGMVKTKALPPSVDKGMSKVTGCHRQEVITRKELSGKKLQDTNNSTVDCVRTKGQQSFPKKKSQVFICRHPNRQTEFIPKPNATNCGLVAVKTTFRGVRKIICRNAEA